MSTAAVLGYLEMLPRPGWTWPAEERAPDPCEGPRTVDSHEDHAPPLAPVPPARSRHAT